MSNHGNHPSRALLIRPGDATARCEMTSVVRAAAQKVHITVPDEFPSSPPLDNFDVAVFGLDGVEDGRRREILECLEAYLERHNLLVYANDVTEEQLGTLFGDLRLGNLLLYDDELPRRDAYTTLRKMSGCDDIFGLEKYLGWGAKTEGYEMQSSASIHELVDEAESFARDLKLPRRLRANLTLVVDELLTNAVYHAPRSSDGTPRFDDVPRTDDVSLADDESVELRLSRDGVRVGVSVRDPFGSLQPDELLTYLGRCCGRDENQISWSTPGAGLGLYQCLQSLSHLVVNLEEGHRTEIIGLITSWNRYSEFASERTVFNLFVSGNRQDAGTE